MTRRPRSMAMTAVLIALVGAVAAATTWSPGPARAAGRSFAVNAFSDIPDRADLIPAPGTCSCRPATGDYHVVNDKITDATASADGSYPVIGHDSGVCLYTQVHRNGNMLGDCSVTVVIHGSSLYVHGILTFTHGNPQTSVIGVIGGTGNYAGATGTMQVRFPKGQKFITYTVNLN